CDGSLPTGPRTPAPSRPWAASRAAKRGCSQSCRRTGCRGCSAGCSTSETFSRLTASAPYRSTTAITPSTWSWAAGPSRVDHEPAESRTDLFGGNSNWRGPIWLPINLLFIGALRRYDSALGQDFTVEYPTGSGRLLTLHDIADDLANRLIAIFLNDENGRRPVF